MLLMRYQVQSKLGDKAARHHLQYINIIVVHADCSVALQQLYTPLALFIMYASKRASPAAYTAAGHRLW